LGDNTRRRSTLRLGPAGSYAKPVAIYTARVNEMSIAAAAAEIPSARLYGARTELALAGPASFCSVSSHLSTRLRFFAKSYWP
jgi:hypothetical protein